MRTMAPSAFGVLLRRYRQTAGLTQEALGERTGLSARGISDLERGISRAPQRETVARLADGLTLPQAEREHLLEAARSGASWPGVVTPAQPGRPKRPDRSSTPERPGGLLIGREGELALLDRHLAGQGPPVLLVAGEPGIGKTRLLGAAIPRAMAQGWRVLEGGCRSHGGQEPYAPLLEALQQHLRSRQAARLRADLQDCAWLVRLLPELAEGPIPPLPTWTTTPEQERRLMVEAMGQFLSNIAGPAGTLLVLDDLQWAGRDALDLLGTLVRTPAGGPVRVIGAYRDTEVPGEAPPAGLITELVHAGLMVRRVLGPLAGAEAAQLLDILLEEADRGAALHERLLQRAGGVPFFLVSCAQAIRAGEDLSGEAVPWDVAQTVRRRITALPEKAQEVLRAAAVVGRVAERRVLAVTMQRPGEQVFDALDIACRSGLLDEEDQISYRFTHDIVREVVYGDLSAARRAALHQRTAEALESLPGVYPVEVLTYHYTRSDVADKAVFYQEQAGDLAAAQLAYVAAADHYQSLVGRLESLGRRYDAARVYAKLGLLRTRAGQIVDGLTALQQFADLYNSGTAVKQPGQTANAAMIEGRGYPSEAAASDFNKILSRMEEHEPEDARGVLYLAYAHYFCVTSQWEERLVVTERAVASARRLRTGAFLAQALNARSAALFMVGRRTEAFAVAQEALQVCEENGDLDLLSQVLISLIYVHVHRGEFAVGSLYNDRSLEIAEAIGDTNGAAWAIERCAWVAKYTGHWKDAEADLTRTLLRTPELEHDPFFNCMRGELCLVMGAWIEARAYLDQAVAEAKSFGSIPAQVCADVFLAELDLLEGRPAAALARAHSAIDRDQGEYTPMLSVWAALSHLQLGELEKAEAAAQQGVRGAIEADDRLALSEALRIQALTAIAQKRWREAEQILEEGLALTRHIGFRYAEARLLHAYGLLHGSRGETTQARERLTEAQLLFQTLGALKDEERVAQDLNGAG